MTLRDVSKKVMHNKFDSIIDLPPVSPQLQWFTVRCGVNSWQLKEVGKSQFKSIQRAIIAFLYLRHLNILPRV